MDKQILQDLEFISQSVGKCPDLVQGGGGNTSAKLDDRYMAVKASGYRLDQVNAKDGYVIVDYQNIRQYFQSVDTTLKVNFETESSEVMRESVLKEYNSKNLRPSIETGFHSFLQKYVIHTHSVYANILCCAKEGKELAEKIFKGGTLGFLWVPYINPGFHLTLGLNKEIAGYHRENNRFPNIIFMENHGVIVTADNARECLELHEKVNEAIKGHFNIEEEYPRVEVEEMEPGLFKSKTKYLKNYLRDNAVGPEVFKDIVLYPDQLVYLGDNVSFDGGQAKIMIEASTGEVRYNTGGSEAKTIDETFTAFVYVVSYIQKLGLTVQTMTDEAIAFIRNMEGEKYRKKLLKEDR